MFPKDEQMWRSLGGVSKKMTLAFLALLMTGSVIALSRIQPPPSSKEAVVSPNETLAYSDALLIKLDVPELTKQAYTILVGAVEDARTLVVGTVISRAGALPYIITDYTVRVERYLKNSLGQESVVVRNRGGRIGNVTVWCSDQAPLTVAERVLLFLVKGVEDGVEMEYFVVLGGFQGKYAMINDKALCKDTDGTKEWSEPLRTLLEKIEVDLRES